MQTANSIQHTCKQSKVTKPSLPLTPKGGGGALAANCGESTRQASCLRDKTSGNQPPDLQQNGKSG